MTKNLEYKDPDEIDVLMFKYGDDKFSAKLYINNHYLFQIKTFKTRKQAIAFVKRLKRSLYA